MPGYPDVRTSRDVVRFLQQQPDVILETALPARLPSGSALVQKVRQVVIRAGITPEDVMSTFQAERKHLQAMLMLHAEPDGQTLSRIHASFDYAIAPFEPAVVAGLNATAGPRRNEGEPFTRFGAQVTRNDASLPDGVQASQGFVYLKVAEAREGKIMGTDDTQAAIKIIKAVKPIDVFCGFGVKTPQDVHMLKNAGADGVFLGAEALHAQEKGLAAFREWWSGMAEAAKA